MTGGRKAAPVDQETIPMDQKEDIMTDGAGKDIISNSAESESANGGDRERKDAKNR